MDYPGLSHYISLYIYCSCVAIFLYNSIHTANRIHLLKDWTGDTEVSVNGLVAEKTQAAGQRKAKTEYIENRHRSQ